MADQANGYKLVFEFPRAMRDLVTGYLHDPWVNDVDWTTLELAPGDFVSGDLRERTNDLLWRIRCKGQNRWVYIYVLLEFQGSVQWYMAVRVASYEMLLYEQLIRTGQVTRGEKLPPIFGMVLYTGEGRWNAARDLGDLVERLPGGSSAQHPRLGYHLLEEKDLAKRDMAGPKNLASALFRLKHSPTISAMLEIVDEMGEWLKEPEQTDLRQALGEWLRRVLLPLRAPKAKLPAMVDLMEAKRLMAEQVIDWGKPWKDEGRREGLKQGEAALLIRLLRNKFGTVPRPIQKRIAAADARTLLRWGERVLLAERIEEVIE